MVGRWDGRDGGASYLVGDCTPTVLIVLPIRGGLIGICMVGNNDAEEDDDALLCQFSLLIGDPCCMPAAARVNNSIPDAANMLVSNSSHNSGRGNGEE